MTTSTSTEAAAGGCQRSANLSKLVNVNNVASLIVNTAGTVAANVNVGPSALWGLAGSTEVVTNAGLFQGTGVVNGNVFNSGDGLPGQLRSETLTINGDYTQNPSGTLRIEVAGASPGQYDVLAVNGTANLAGTLQLVRLGGFRLRVGDQITFLTASGVSGTFDNVQNDFLATGSIVVFDVVYLPQMPSSWKVRRVCLRNLPVFSAARRMRWRWARRSTAQSVILGHRS